MQGSLLARVIETALKGFTKSVGEGIVHILLLIGSIALPLFKGKNYWEAATTFILMVCGLVAIHLVRAVVSVWRDVAHSPTIREVESLIYTSDHKRNKQIVVESPPKYFEAKLIGIGFIGLIVLAILSYVALGLGPPQIAASSPTSPQPTEIYMDCHHIELPIRIPVGGTAHVKAFNKKHFANAAWSMFDFPNDGTEERLWPDSKALNSMKFNPGVFGYRCDVTNHAQANLIDVVVQLNTNFDNEKQPLIYKAVVSPLDGGSTFSFYLINECPVSVSAIVPAEVTAQVFGEEKRRTIPLNFSHRNPMEQIMMFFPSKVSWTGNVCE